MQRINDRTKTYDNIEMKKKKQKSSNSNEESPKKQYSEEPAEIICNCTMKDLKCFKYYSKSIIICGMHAESIRPEILLQQHTREKNGEIKWKCIKSRNSNTVADTFGIKVE